MVIPPSLMVLFWLRIHGLPFPGDHAGRPEVVLSPGLFPPPHHLYIRIILIPCSIFRIFVGEIPPGCVWGLVHTRNIQTTALGS